METNGGEESAVAEGSLNESENHDKFCYYCHEECERKKHHSCSKCFKSFHEYCFNKARREYPNISNNSLCLDCASMEISKKGFEGKRSALKLLKYTKTAISNHRPGKFKKLLNSNKWKKSRHSSTIVKPMDLNAIFRKINENSYDSTDAFINDVACIVHNCSILYSNRDEMARASRNLLNFCLDEERFLSNCPDCYGYVHAAESQSVNPCRTLHLILNVRLRRINDFWAAEEGFHNFPAKLVAIHDVSKTIRVIFFGSKRYYDIAPNNCSLYTARSDIRSDPQFKNHKTKCKKALEELESYIEDLKETFGEVETDLPLIFFDAERLNEHLEEMFPGRRVQTNESPNDDANNNAENGGNDIENNDEEMIDSDNGRRVSGNGDSKSNEDSGTNHGDPDASNDDVPAKSPHLISSDHQDDDVNDVTMESIEISSTKGDDSTGGQRLNEINENAHEQSADVEDRINMLNSTSQREIEALKHELDNAQKSRAEWETKYNELLAQLMMTSARNKTISNASDDADYRKEIDELNKKLKANADAIEQMKETHEQEMKMMCTAEQTRILLFEYNLTNQMVKSKNDFQLLENEKNKMEQDFNAKILQMTVELDKAQRDHVANDQTCIACDDTFKLSRFCSSTCESYWNTLQNMDHSDE